jgi:hypothetical protein
MAARRRLTEERRPVRKRELTPSGVTARAGAWDGRKIIKKD